MSQPNIETQQTQPTAEQLTQATQQATQEATQQAAQNAENMTAKDFRDWMDSLPDKIADAIDVKFGLRRQESGGGSETQQTQQTTETTDPKGGGFLGSGKSFTELWFGK